MLRIFNVSSIVFYYTYKYARKTKTPIDSLVFDTDFRGYYIEDAKNHPGSENGVLIHGPFLEGCKWDEKR